MSRAAARDDPLFPQALQRVGHCERRVTSHIGHVDSLEVHHLYRLALATLFSAGLSSQGTIGGLLVMGRVKMANGAWVRGEIEEDGT